MGAGGPRSPPPAFPLAWGGAPPRGFAPRFLCPSLRRASFLFCPSLRRAAGACPAGSPAADGSAHPFCTQLRRPPLIQAGAGGKKGRARYPGENAPGSVWQSSCGKRALASFARLCAARRESAPRAARRPPRGRTSPCIRKKIAPQTVKFKNGLKFRLVYLFCFVYSNSS